MARSQTRVRRTQSTELLISADIRTLALVAAWLIGTLLGSTGVV